MNVLWLTRSVLCWCQVWLPLLPSPSHSQPTLRGLNGFIHRTITWLSLARGKIMYEQAIKQNAHSLPSVSAWEVSERCAVGSHLLGRGDGTVRKWCTSEDGKGRSIVSSRPFAEWGCSLQLWLGIEQRRLRRYSTSLVTSWPSGSFISQFDVFFLLGCDLRGKYNLFTLPFHCILEAGFLWLCRVLRFFAMTEILSYEQMVAKPLRSSFSSFCSLQAAQKGGNIHHIAWETVKRNTILVCFEFGLLD